MVRITSEDIESARKGNYYLCVDYDKLRHWKITTAVNKFNKDSTIVFLPTLKLAGRRDNVIKSLVESGYDRLVAEKLLEEAYTASNYNKPFQDNGKKEQFEEEVNKSLVKPRETKSNNVTLKLLKDLMKNNPKSVRNNRDKKSGDKVEKFKNKFYTVPFNKLLDVSNLTDDGKGSKLVNKPVKQPKNKIYNSELPLISSSADKYNLAIKLINDKRYNKYLVNQ